MAVNKFSVLVLVIFYLVNNCQSLNILAITPHVGKSHQLVFEPLFKKLATNGHSVTLITRYPMNFNHPNWRDINIAPIENNNTEFLTFDVLTGTRQDRYLGPVILVRAAETACSDGLTHPNLQNFLKEDIHFDVVLIEMFNTNCFMGIAQKYQAPIVGLHSASWMPWMYEWFGVPYNPGCTQSHFLGINLPMTFLDRLENTVAHVYAQLMYKALMARGGNSLSKRHIGVDLYENGDAMKSVSILLINTHYTLNLPTPLVPNTIEIGGIHTDSQPLKKLPQEIEKFIQESKDGVIYMSMGSTIRGDTFPEDKVEAFLRAFSKLPQRVIWKWEGEMKNKPDNVFTTRWAPQRDILCHPNVKVFIAHGGLLGVLESVDCGIPVMVLPQFGDQFSNAVALEKVGGGLKFILSEITEEVVLETVKKLMSPKYIESARQLSERFKDRPLPPMDTALYWIDYVVKHKGAPFMKSPATDMPSYQYYLIDVILFLCFTVFLSMYLIYSCCGLICRRKANKIKTS